MSLSVSFNWWMIAAGVSTPFQMPVYAMGVTEHETPFSFGSSLPPLTFTWAVNSREVLHLESVYHGVSSCLTFSFPSSVTFCSVQLLPLVPFSLPLLLTARCSCFLLFPFPFLCYSLQCAAPSSCSLPLLLTAVCSTFFLFPSSATHWSVQLLPLVSFLC